MARKSWKIAYKGNSERSPIYANYKKGLFIMRGSKQLGSFDDFKQEKYPVFIQGTGGKEIDTKWFSTKPMANKYLKSYMRIN